MNLLKTGERYELQSLVCIGWVDSDNNLYDHIDGYQVCHYFDSFGVYLGPDAEGIEPFFSSEQNTNAWGEIFTCPRCNLPQTPYEVEFKSIRECPRCGFDEHPVFLGLDELNQ